MKLVWIAAAVVLLAAIGAATWNLGGGEPAPAARVAVSDIREYVDERGETRLPETFLVSMPYAARVQKITLEEGDRVSAGEVVAQVSPKDLANEVAEAQAAVDRLAAAIAENDDVSVERGLLQQTREFVESMVSTVAAANARKTAGKRRLDYAEDYLADTRRLAESNARTQEEVDRADVQYVESQVDYQQDVLVAEALTSIQAATELLPQMVQDYIDRKSLSRAVLEKEKSEAEARLRQAQLRQQRGQMTSPVEGVVLERPISDERFLPAGEMLLEIGKLSDLEVEAEVLSQDAVRVEQGDEVEIYGPAIGGSVGAGAAGVVERIYPEGFTKVSSLGVEQQRVLVIIRFAPGVLEELRRERDLGVGYEVRVRIFTDRATGALTLPRAALFRGPGGQWQVFAVEDGKARRKTVEVGLMNDRAAQIAGGLADGDIVLLAPDNTIQDGDDVQPLLDG